MAKTRDYDLVARWAGGNNAGHTVYVDGQKYKTHLVPSGIFYGIPSLVGPGCVLHPKSFQDELDYLGASGFNTDLIKVHPNCHIVLDKHIAEDKERLAAKLGTTSKGIAPVYSSKAARTGVLAKQVLSKKLLWNSNLRGTILCEGAQGVWLDIDHGNYPFITSSITLPYGACGIGFPPQKIRSIFGAAKAYDTRSGEDPLFPASLLEDPELLRLANVGNEFGVTTGRRRKTRWLDLDRLVDSINLTGTTQVVISKVDVIREVGIFKLYWHKKLLDFNSYEDWELAVSSIIHNKCPLTKQVKFSSSPESI